jgi:ceramide glucosyltransferase
MPSFTNPLPWLCLFPVVAGSVYAVLGMGTALVFGRRAARLRPALPPGASWPPVTVLKPVYGLEKNLADNLRSLCRQDYPSYQVVFSAQRTDDPAIPLLHDLQREFGAERVTVTVNNLQAGLNGKVNNMLGGLAEARHEVLVISDSDVVAPPDYLKVIVAPLADPQVGCACTLFKATRAERWFEKLELLSINADFMAGVIFAYVTGSSKFCLGPSTALRRSTLEAIGGLASLGDYLVEDFEMGRRIWQSGKRMAVQPYFVEAVVDLRTPGQWWTHQVYWDQNTRAARPIGFFATILVRAVPFALLYALLRLGDGVGLAVLGAAVAVRLLTTAVILRWGLRDREGLRSLALLPFRDVAGLLSWALAFTQRTVMWRGAEFVLTRHGRLVPRETRA